VTLATGRTFTGHVDRRTDDAALVLLFGRAGATLRRTIEWDRITAAAIGEQAVALADLRAAAESLKLPEEKAGVKIRESGPESQEPAPGGQRAALRRVASISFDARLANWDGDVEQDGLLVDIFPLDEDWHLSPVSGTVEVELFAPQRRVFHHAPQSYGATLDRVERWSRSVRLEDFGSNGVRLRLPFGAVHPEFNDEWYAYGLVHVRLIAPGHGVFDDSRDAVRIRPWAPNRDQQQLKNYPRFLPNEAAGRRD
jgi:hypothetical protein